MSPISMCSVFEGLKNLFAELWFARSVVRGLRLRSVCNEKRLLPYQLETMTDQKKTTPWKSIDGGKRRIRATYGWSFFEGQLPHWSVTGETERAERSRWGEDTVGCLHGPIASAFPFLADAIKFHLVDSGVSPMHYLANGWYWIELASGRSEWSVRAGQDPELAFTSHALLGELPGDLESWDAIGGFRCSRAGFEAWATHRLDGLRVSMRGMVESLGMAMAVSKGVAK